MMENTNETNATKTDSLKKLCDQLGMSGAHCFSNTDFFCAFLAPCC